MYIRCRVALICQAQSLQPFGLKQSSALHAPCWFFQTARPAHSSPMPLTARFYMAPFSYEHRENNGWIRYEMLTLVSFAGTFVKSTGVKFCTQRGRRSGLHGTWSPSPSGLIVAFNWKGNDGTDKQHEFIQVVEGVYRLILPNSDIIVIKLTGVRTTMFENTWALDDVVGEWQLV